MKNIIIVILLFFITGCTSAKKEVKYSIRHKLDSYFKKNYGLNNGYLIAMYGLLDNNANIIATDYVNIINDPNYFEKYLNRINKTLSSVCTINNNAYFKNIKLKNLILNINKNYPILSFFDEAAFKNNVTHKKGEYFKELINLDKIVSSLPIMTPLNNYKVTSNFGLRKISHKKVKFHHGIDLQAPYHSLIFAPGDGIVKNVRRQNGYGNVIDINHENKFISRFAHLHDVYVQNGQNIKKGEAIGTQGRTGNARGEHLHYEILHNNRPINPAIFLGLSIK